MARTFNITDGTTPINLLNESGFIPTSLGMGQMRLLSNQPSGHLRFSETYELYLYSSDQDHAAEQLQGLYALLRKAHLYHTTSWQNVPVYLTAQTDRETNPRYALVYDSPQLTMPDVFDVPFATADFLEEFGITIIRGVWRSGAPGTAPTALTLTATSAPNNASVMPVANFYDNTSLTGLKNYDGASFADTDLRGAQAVTIYGATYDSNYILYAGSSDGPFHNLCFTLAQDREGGNELALAYTTDAYAQMSTNTGWGVQSKSSDFLTTTDGLTGFRAVTWRSGQDAAYTSRAWTQVAVDGETGYWMQLQPDGTPDTDAPAITTSDGIYTQNKPYIELSSDSLKGDIPPMVNMRLWNAGQHPANGSSDSRAWNVAKIIMGAKTDPGSFASHLNASGGGLPSTDWVVAYDTDTTGNAASSNADVNTPGGYYAACAFGLTTQTTRVQFVGNNLLDAYRGEYKAFLRAEQVGGTDGDVSAALKIRMGSTDAYMPARLGELVDLSTHDKGYEIVDLGLFSVPFHEVADTDFEDADIIFEIQAVQNSAGATLKIADLVLIPVDEWAIVLDDPISDNNLGASALWGNQYIEYDSGVLGHKTGKYMLESGTGNAFPAENWFYGGRPFNVEPGKQTRIYFLMGHWHPDLGWGNEPIVSDPSSLLAIELRAQALYLSLRGAD